MSNDSEEISPGDLVNEQVARNMAESATPPEPPPAAVFPEKPPASSPEADLHASISSSVQAAQLPKAATNPAPTATPFTPSGRQEVNVNPDYLDYPEQNVRTPEQPAPVDLSPLLSAIEKLTETIKELKPTEEKKAVSGPEAEAVAKQPEKPAPVETVDPDSRRRESKRFTAPTDDQWWNRHLAENEQRRQGESWAMQPRISDPREEPRPAPPPPSRPPAQQSVQSSPKMPVQQQAPDSGQMAGKFQKEMQQFMSANAQALQQLMGVVESVTSAVGQQNTKMAQMQAQLAQLTQFASSTLQKSQKAGYR